MPTDPLAVLRCWAVEVVVGGMRYRIEERSAGEWIEAMLSGQIVPALLAGESASRLAQDVLDGRLSQDVLDTASREAVSQASGRDWWEAGRLVALARDHPDLILGELIRVGFDFERRSLGAYCVAVYAIAVRNMDKKERGKFDMELKRVPVDVVADDEDALTAAFMAAMNQKI